MVKKIPAMYFVFVALLENPKEHFPCAYNFRPEARICELFLSRAIPKAAAKVVARQITIAACVA
jgi:hypothetical protein